VEPTVVEPTVVEPIAAASIVEPAAADAIAVEVAPPAKKSRRKNPTGAPAKPRSRRKSVTTAETAVVAAPPQLDLAPAADVALDVAPVDVVPVDVVPVVVEPAIVDVATVIDAIEVVDLVDLVADTAIVPAQDVAVEPAAIWAPRMPTVAPTSTPPWRRPSFVAATPIAPSLVIDDADPDSAERELDERRAERDHGPTVRRSFLPPILLDREDRSARQGGLTLAVIILLIAATLTLSYLMRRPSSSGDGVTQAERPAPTQLV
jgi:hypothetical protein